MAGLGHAEAEISQGRGPCQCRFLPPAPQLGSVPSPAAPGASPDTHPSALQTRCHSLSALAARASPAHLGQEARRAHSRVRQRRDPRCPAWPRQAVRRGPGLGSAAWRSGAARGAQEARGGRRGAGCLVLAAPGGGRAGNVACAPGNAPIALSPRRARSVWSLLALMGTDSAAGAGQGRGRGAGSGGDSGTGRPLRCQYAQARQTQLPGGTGL